MSAARRRAINLTTQAIQVLADLALVLQPEPALTISEIPVLLANEKPGGEDRGDFPPAK